MSNLDPEDRDQPEPDDHAFGSDTDLRRLRNQAAAREQQPEADPYTGDDPCGWPRI